MPLQPMKIHSYIDRKVIMEKALVQLAHKHNAPRGVYLITTAA